jgi:lysophospholipase L1-like esterase
MWRFALFIVVCIIIGSCSKPAGQTGPVRVACLGTSITAGFTAQSGRAFSYPARLQTYIGDRYEVRNLGLSESVVLRNVKDGHSYWNNEYHAWQVCETYEPEIVILEFGTNESKASYDGVRSSFSADYQAMIDALKAWPTPPKIIIVNPLICEGGHQINCGLLDTVIRPQIIALAKKNKLPIIDFYSGLKGLPLLRDGIHPNELGIDSMGTIAARVVKAMGL